MFRIKQLDRSHIIIILRPLVWTGRSRGSPPKHHGSPSLYSGPSDISSPESLALTPGYGSLLECTLPTGRQRMRDEIISLSAQ